MSNLVISRLPGESFTIGDDVTVTILENESRAVRIAINAPRDIKILRSELANRPAPVANLTKPEIHYKRRRYER